LSFRLAAVRELSASASTIRRQGGKTLFAASSLHVLAQRPMITAGIHLSAAGPMYHYHITTPPGGLIEIQSLQRQGLYTGQHGISASYRRYSIGWPNLCTFCFNGYQHYRLRRTQADLRRHVREHPSECRSPIRMLCGCRNVRSDILGSAPTCIGKLNRQNHDLSPQTRFSADLRYHETATLRQPTTSFLTLRPAFLVLANRLCMP
jgi:hypothetical protein